MLAVRATKASRLASRRTVNAICAPIMLPTRAFSAIRAAVVTHSAPVKIPTAMEGYEYAALMRAIEVVKTKPLLLGCAHSRATSCASYLCPFCSSSREAPTDERSITHSRCP